MITVNTEQIEELRSAVNNSRQAIENGNMTEALNQLTAVDQQLELLIESASPFASQ